MINYVHMEKKSRGIQKSRKSTQVEILSFFGSFFCVCRSNIALKNNLNLSKNSAKKTYNIDYKSNRKKLIFLEKITFFQLLVKAFPP